MQITEDERKQLLHAYETLSLLQWDWCQRTNQDQAKQWQAKKAFDQVRSILGNPDLRTELHQGGEWLTNGSQNWTPLL